MLVPSTRERDGEILEVAVIRGSANELTLRFCRHVASGHETPGIIQVLNDFSAIDQIEGLLAQVLKDIFVRRKNFKPTGWSG
jgi:hypothetical protein